MMVLMIVTLIIANYQPPLKAYFSLPISSTMKDAQNFLEERLEIPPETQVIHRSWLVLCCNHLIVMLNSFRSFSLLVVT